MRQRFIAPPIPSSEITAETAYLKRRDIMRAAAVAAALDRFGRRRLPDDRSASRAPAFALRPSAPRLTIPEPAWVGGRVGLQVRLRH